MSNKAFMEVFRNDIVCGNIVEGSRLPTFRQLGEYYNCSAATIKRSVDKLEESGLLQVIRGRGTFVVGSDAPAQTEKAKIIGAVILEDQFMRELNAIKMDYLKNGWFFSIYDATPDEQSPELERLFLSKALEQNFCAVIISASPHQPVNQELFAGMRKQGIKIIHISPYSADMSKECSFQPDFKHCGVLAAAKAALKGYRNIIYLARSEAPYSSLIHSGINSMADELGLQYAKPIYAFNGDEKTLANALENLEPETAILCVDTEIGEQVCRLAAERNLVPPRDFGLVSVLGTIKTTPHHSHLSFDYSEIIRDVLAYATDNTRSAEEMIQQVYSSHFNDLNTL